MMEIIVDHTGTARCIYGEEIDLAALGYLNIIRVSTVEVDARGTWWADLSAVGGPTLGPFRSRSAALAAEVDWLHRNVLRGGA